MGYIRAQDTNSYAMKNYAAHCPIACFRYAEQGVVRLPYLLSLAALLRLLP